MEHGLAHGLRFRVVMKIPRSQARKTNQLSALTYLIKTALLAASEWHLLTAEAPNTLSSLLCFSFLAYGNPSNKACPFGAWLGLLWWNCRPRKGPTSTNDSWQSTPTLRKPILYPAPQHSRWNIPGSRHHHPSDAFKDFFCLCSRAADVSRWSFQQLLPSSNFYQLL